jgi:hypothetical protein
MLFAKQIHRNKIRIIESRYHRRSVDAARLKDYTLTELKKRMKSRVGGGTKETTAE